MIERYSRPEMSAIWSDQSRYETWLEVELAACRAMEDGGSVPKGTASRIAASVQIDAEHIAEIEREVRHDVIAFLTSVEERVGEAARWLHLGMTSSDVLDTAFALQLLRAGRLLSDGLSRLCAALKRRAKEYRDTPIVGRSHGIHAEPTSLGLVLAGLYAEMQRNQGRLQSALQGLRFGKIAGAVGAYGNVVPEVERVALEGLGLRPETCATQVVPRDRHAQFFATLGLLAAGLERIALQVRHWQRTEVGEAQEAFASGQKGSSAMPHKKNPILSENLTGLARLVRNYADVALENVALWHERDISHSSVERVIAPDATILLDFMLHRAVGLVEGLRFDVQRMETNLEATGGLIFSEAVLLALVRKGMPRQGAYKRVQAAAVGAAGGEGTFRQRLADDEEISKRLSMQEIEQCFDLRHHLRFTGQIFARVFEAETEI